MTNAFVERESCPGCGFHQSKMIYSVGLLDEPVVRFFFRKLTKHSMLPLFEGTKYELQKCSACGLIYQHYVLTDEFTELLYDDWLINCDAEPELSRVHIQTDRAIYYANELVGLARFFEKPTREITILDYGAGIGWWCRMAAALGFDVYGTDISMERVENLMSGGISTVPYGNLPRQQFDFINTEQVFEHLARPREVINRLADALKPGGILKVSVPQGRRLERRLKGMDWTAPRGSRHFLGSATPLIHINTFTYNSIVAMGEAAGFVPAVVPLPKWYSIVNLTSLKAMSKSLALPIFRRLDKSTYVFLKLQR